MSLAIRNGMIGFSRMSSNIVSLTDRVVPPRRLHGKGLYENRLLIPELNECASKCQSEWVNYPILRRWTTAGNN